MPRESTLDGEARLEERERPGDGVRSSMQKPGRSRRAALSLSVKGGIARAPACLQFCLEGRAMLSKRGEL